MAVLLSDPLSYYLAGQNGQGIVLVHGMTGAPSEMKLLARRRHRKGYTVQSGCLSIEVDQES